MQFMVYTCLTMSSKYPNYHVMEQMRKLKFLRSNKCACCKQEAFVIHHKDLSTSNHSRKNLQLLCRSCHTKLHWRKTRKLKTKYVRLYGMTSGIMAKRFHTTTGNITRWHKMGVLEKCLQTGKGPGTKGIRLYGMTFTAIAGRLKVSKQWIHYLHKIGKLHNTLKKYHIH